MFGGGMTWHDQRWLIVVLEAVNKGLWIAWDHSVLVSNVAGSVSADLDVLVSPMILCVQRSEITVRTHTIQLESAQPTLYGPIASAQLRVSRVCLPKSV